MTLAERLLPKLSDWHPAGDGRHSWSENLADGWSVHLSADKSDSLSCLVWELALTRESDAAASVSLKDWATRVAGRVTGLLEQLTVHEIDEQEGVAVLRSKTPSMRFEKLGYYEVRLDSRSRASVHRYTASRMISGREQIAFALTHEVLAKLTEDLLP